MKTHNLILIFTIILVFANCSSPSDKNEITSSTSKQVQILKSEKTTFLEKLDFTNLNGEAMNSSQFTNKILILNIWATWCKPCVKEMPDLEAMMTQLPKEFELILASNEDLKKINGFIDRQQLNLSFAKLENSIESLGAYALPTTFIIGKNGQLIETLVGARDWKSQETINYLKEITQ